MIIKNGLVFCEDMRFHPLDVSVEEGRISSLGEAFGSDGAVYDAGGCLVLPGLVDIHTHGCVGEDFSDGLPEGWPAMSRAYAKNGTTSFLATTMTLPEDTLAAAMDIAAGFVSPEDGAQCLGVHLEGPFLSYKKRGAQAAEHLCTPDTDMFLRLQRRSGGKVRMVTVAPEEPGALEFIKKVSPGCTVSIGHTCADYEQAAAAFEAGADHVTHLYNGMPPLLHRDPGPIGAAADKGAAAELICDGLHIHPSAVRAAQKLFGDRLLLISDSIRCTGLTDGDYTLGGQAVTVSNGRATLADGTLAGSAVFLLQCLQNAVAFGIPLEAAVYAATAAPADSAGIGDTAGRILPGRRADIIVLERDCSLKQVFIAGRPIL